MSVNTYKGLNERQLSSSEPIPPVGPPANWDREVDIIVVGAGGSGLAATTKIAVEGISVIAIEKDEDVGGATQHATGCEGWGTKAQERAKIKISEDEILSMWVTMHNFRPNVKTLRTLLRKGVQFLNWTEDLGFEWEVQLWGFPSLHIPKGVLGRRWLMPQRDTIDFLHKVAVKKGAEIMLGANAVALVLEKNGRVAGIKVERNVGTLFIKGRKAVILATGGMSENREMLKQYIPMAYEGCGSSYDMPINTGDGIRLGLGVGADMAGYNSFCVFNGGIPYSEESKGSWHRYLYSGDICLSRQPWLYVNKVCERFANEYAPGIGYVTMAIAGMAQPNHEYYTIFDKNYEKDIWVFKGQYCERPLTPDLPGMAEWSEDRWNCPKDWRISVKKAIEAGAIHVGNTIEELAVKLGLDPTNLLNTVKRYNEYCKEKKDPEYGKPPEFLIPVMDPPFYGIRQRAQLVVTHCGLRINEKMQVLDKDLKIIPGLYAAYHTAGGDIGENIVGMGINGECLTAYASGYMAAESAIAEGK